MPVALLRAGHRVETIFDLLGDDENDMSAAVGYAMTHAPAYLRRIVRELVPSSPPCLEQSLATATIRMQTGRPGAGVTDLELLVGHELYAILEAKRGPTLPTLAQLALYAPVAAQSHAKHRLLVTLTNLAPSAVLGAATNAGYGDSVGGVQVRHLSWRRLLEFARDARPEESHAGRRLLDQFTSYLGAILGMATKYSNLVYVVSLGHGTPEGWQLTWRDIVHTRRRYFYRITGGGWPDPPNYLGFRYDGHLQAIHHVEGADVFTNPRTVFPEAADENWEPHYLLRLGPPFRPPNPVPNGPRVLRNNRVWCMLDTLFTSKTISDAVTETKRRREE